MAVDVPGFTESEVVEATAAQRYKAVKVDMLSWASNCVEGYPVKIDDLDSSFADGRGLMAIINASAPHVLDYAPQVGVLYVAFEYLSQLTPG